MFRQVSGERALLTPLASPRAFQPQAVVAVVGFILGQMTSSTTSPPLQRPTTLAQKHGLGMPDSICHYHQACAHGCLTNNAAPPEGPQPVVDLASTAVCSRVHPMIASWTKCERNIRPRIIN